MKPNTESTVTPTAPAAPTTGLYEVTMPGNEPLKIGGALCYSTARVRLTKDQADALLAHRPLCLKFLGL